MENGVPLRIRRQAGGAERAPRSAGRLALRCHLDLVSDPNPLSLNLTITTPIRANGMPWGRVEERWDPSVRGMANGGALRILRQAAPVYGA